MGLGPSTKCTTTTRLRVTPVRVTHPQVPVGQDGGDGVGVINVRRVCGHVRLVGATWHRQLRVHQRHGRGALGAQALWREQWGRRGDDSKLIAGFILKDACSCGTASSGPVSSMAGAPGPLGAQALRRERGRGRTGNTCSASQQLRIAWAARTGDPPSVRRRSGRRCRPARYYPLHTHTRHLRRLPSSLPDPMPPTLIHVPAPHPPRNPSTGHPPAAGGLARSWRPQRRMYLPPSLTDTFHATPPPTHQLLSAVKL